MSPKGNTLWLYDIRNNTEHTASYLVLYDNATGRAVFTKPASALEAKSCLWNVGTKYEKKLLRNIKWNFHYMPFYKFA